MKKILEQGWTLFCLGLMAVGLISSGAGLKRASTTPPQAEKSQALRTYGQLPLSFEANQGQADPEAKFLARGRGYTLFLTRRGDAVLSLQRAPEAGSAQLRMNLVGSNKAPRAAGADKLSGKTNYFMGNDPAKWRRNVPNYARVRYEEVYPGVDLVYYGKGRQLEYDFVVSPGFDPSRIELRIEGADRAEVDNAGDLVLSAAGGEMRQRRPFVYQEIAGIRHEIAGRYVLRGDSESGVKVGFEIADYDRSRALVIDPILNWATYLGGANADEGNGIAVDSSGNVYVAGVTASGNFPTINPRQGSFAGGFSDVFISKLNPTGTALIYSTYLGGVGTDIASAIAVDASGNMYITGETDSINYPTFNPLSTALSGGRDIIVTKLDPTGANILYSTYIGGTGIDQGFGIGVDSAGSAIITGQGLASGFVLKLTPAGNAAAYSAPLNGGVGFGVFVDSAGNAYATGSITNPAWPVSGNAFQPTIGGGTDAFVMKITSSGVVVYATFLGGDQTDRGHAIAADSAGNAYVTGFTDSANFPTAGALQPASGGLTDAFVTKLNPTGTAVMYSTYLGGNSLDTGLGIAVDSTGSAHVVGQTESANFPKVAALQSTFAITDAFVSRLNPGGSALVFSTYLGGEASDGARAVALNTAGDPYVTGRTLSPNFPVTSGAFQMTFSGGAFSDAFVVSYGPDNPVPTITSISPNTAPVSGGGFTLSVTGTGFVAGSVVRWNGSDRTTTFISATELSATIPASDVATAGTAQVTVFNPAPGGGASNAISFSITNVAPTLALLIPTSASAGGPAFQLTVNGSRFLSTSVVRWNGSDRTTTFDGPNQLRVAIPASDIAAAGEASVTVFNPPPGGGASNALTFTIIASAPIIAQLQPATAVAGSAAFTLTVTGERFTSNSVVRWNANDRPTTFVSATRLTAAIPAGDVASAGTAQVTVVAPGLGTSSAVAFTITAPPSPVINPNGIVNAASFALGAAVGPGSIASLFGSNFTSQDTFAQALPLPTTLGGVSVRFNNILAPLFFAGPRQINLQIPWELSGQTSATVTVTVNTLSSAPQTVNLTAFAPGIFTVNQSGSGQAAVLIAGTAFLAAPAGTAPGARPVLEGEFISIYCLGLDGVTNQPATGAAALGNPLSTTTNVPTVSVGASQAEVTFAGLAPGFVGLYQINARIPVGAPEGNAVPLLVTIGRVTAPVVTIAVQ